MNKIKITYACFLNQSGYSQAAQGYILALNETGEFDIKIRIFGEKPAKPAISDENYEIFMEMVKKEEDTDRILIYHCIPTMQKRIKKVNKNIGMVTYETYSPPEKWVEILNQNDAIIVPSNFNYKIFSHMQIKKPLYYIPHCIDKNIYNKDVKPIREYDRYTFLFMGIWRDRKGTKQLLEAWLKEFKESDGFQLLIKTDKTKKAEEYIKHLKSELGINKGFAPIIFENKVFDEKELPNFIKSVDCLISPHMGEGFGLLGLQCMALGIPVIITDFSGSQDYANETTATLIKPKGFIFRGNMDNIPQFKNKKWAFIEVKDIQKNMRYVIENKEKVKIKANVAYSEVRSKFSYERVSKLFIEMIKELYG